MKSDCIRVPNNNRQRYDGTRQPGYAYHEQDAFHGPLLRIIYAILDCPVAVFLKQPKFNQQKSFQNDAEAFIYPARYNKGVELRRCIVECQE